MIQLSNHEFDAVVQQAIERLPEAFAQLLDNIFVIVEETPTVDDLEAVGMTPDQVDELFGLYHGVPLDERGFEYTGLPDRVVIYRRPILLACRSRNEALTEIRDTLVHELGHHFGLSDDEMPF